MAIGGYCIVVIVLMVISGHYLGGYSINGYWWLLYCGYSINGYWWSLSWSLFY